MMASWRGIQRLSTSRFPFAYLQLLSVGLFIYMFSAALAIVPIMGWYTPLMILFLGIFFFGKQLVRCPVYSIPKLLAGVDRVGHEIQDPFGYDENDLPMYNVVKQTQIDMAEVLFAFNRFDV